MTAAQHSAEDACFFCAIDEELARGLNGRERRTIHMQTTTAQCPHWDTEETDQ